jgi:hypothetical protein
MHSFCPDCAAHTLNAQYFVRTMLPIIQMHSFCPDCAAHNLNAQFPTCIAFPRVNTFWLHFISLNHSLVFKTSPSLMLTLSSPFALCHPIQPSNNNWTPSATPYVDNISPPIHCTVHVTTTCMNGGWKRDGGGGFETSVCRCCTDSAFLCSPAFCCEVTERSVV